MLLFLLLTLAAVDVFVSTVLFLLFLLLLLSLLTGTADDSVAFVTICRRRSELLRFLSSSD